MATDPAGPALQLPEAAVCTGVLLPARLPAFATAPLCGNLDTENLRLLARLDLEPFNTHDRQQFAYVAEERASV